MSETMGTMIDTDAAFVARLLRLTSIEKARLKAAAGKNKWSPDVLSVIAPFLPDVEGRDRDGEVMRLTAVATLYALNPTPKGRDSLGTAMAKIKIESVADRLMRQILACDSIEALWKGPLLRAVQKLAGDGVAINWSALARDLRIWRSPHKRTQQKWAKDFWSATGRKDQ